MKILITLCLLICFLSKAEAQQESSIHFGINISPRFSKVIVNDSNLEDAELTFGMSAGIDVYYDINNQLQVRSGIGYSYLPAKVTNYRLVLDSDFDLPEEEAIYNSWYGEQYRGHFFTLPLELKYKILGKEQHLFGKMGGEVLILLNENNEIGFNRFSGANLNRDFTSQLSPLIFTGNIGLGAEFKIYQSFKSIVELQFGYSINQLFDTPSPAPDWVYNGYLFTMGLLLGCRF